MPSPKTASDGVAIAAGHVAQHLIVGAVFTDDHEHVLDQRRIADLCRDCDRRLHSGCHRRRT